MSWCVKSKANWLRNNIVLQFWIPILMIISTPKHLFQMVWFVEINDIWSICVLVFLWNRQYTCSWFKNSNMVIFSWCLTSGRVFSEWLIPEPGESYLPQIPAVPTPNPSATNKSDQVSLIWNFLTTCGSCPVVTICLARKQVFTIRQDP